MDTQLLEMPKVCVKFFPRRPELIVTKLGHELKSNLLFMYVGGSESEIAWRGFWRWVRTATWCRKFNLKGSVRSHCSDSSQRVGPVWGWSVLTVLCCLLQVWESTPGFGEKPFLDTLWSSIDEVRGVWAPISVFWGNEGWYISSCARASAVSPL